MLVVLSMVGEAWVGELLDLGWIGEGGQGIESFHHT